MKCTQREKDYQINLLKQQNLFLEDILLIQRKQTKIQQLSAEKIFEQQKSSAKKSLQEQTGLLCIGSFIAGIYSYATSNTSEIPYEVSIGLLIFTGCIALLGLFLLFRSEDI